MACRPKNCTDRFFSAAYKLASVLSDPIWCAHHRFKKISVVDPRDSKIGKFVKNISLGAQALGMGMFSMVTTPLGSALRCAAVSFQSKPFIHFSGDLPEQPLSPSIKLLSWNLCCLPGGYSIPLGVQPWSYRIKALIEAIRAQGADVVCLYEIFDIQTALHLYNGLKDRYAHFYFNIGPKKVFGSTSGLFVASTMKVVRPRFIYFPKSAIDGRTLTQNCGKGIFSFDLAELSGAEKMRIYTTHLQHSEIQTEPTQSEKNARLRGMDLLIQDLNLLRLPAICTGVFNMDDEEYSQSSLNSRFDKGVKTSLDVFSDEDDVPPSNNPTGALNHCTVVLKNQGFQLSTNFIETGADKSESYALTDQKGLLTSISKVNLIQDYFGE